MEYGGLGGPIWFAPGHRFVHESSNKGMFSETAYCVICRELEDARQQIANLRAEVAALRTFHEEVSRSYLNALCLKSLERQIYAALAAIDAPAQSDAPPKIQADADCPRCGCARHYGRCKNDGCDAPAQGKGE